MNRKKIHIFNSSDYWFYKILDICFCITYPDTDDDESDDSWEPVSKEKPVSVPNTAIMEREKELQKELILHNLPYDENL